MKIRTHLKSPIHDQVVFEEVGCCGRHTLFNQVGYVGPQHFFDAIEASCRDRPVLTIQY